MAKHVKEKLSILDYVDIYFNAAEQRKDSNDAADYFLSEMKRRKVPEAEFLEGIKFVQSIAEQMLAGDENKSITRMDVIDEILRRLDEIKKVLHKLEKESNA